MLDVSSTRWPERTFHFHSTRERMTLAELAEQSRRFAGGLRAHGVRRGDLVALVLPSCRDFFVAWFGILRAGAVPAPLALPTASRGLEPYFQRLRRILADADMHHLLLPDRFLPLVPVGALEGIRVLSPSTVSAEASTLLDEPLAPQDLVMVQYTSGSTSQPKGVALQHQNLLAALRAIAHGIQVTEADVNGQWLPLHHDMGLIGALAGIAAGVEHHIWSPSSFIKDPGGWLEEFARLRATVYAGPNFSYGYLLSSVDDEQLARLDLSAWRIAFNGAEPIDPKCVQRFLERFAPAGLRPSTLLPVYGLAEVTLPATFPPLGVEPRITWVDREVLAREHQARPVPAAHPNARGVLSVGRPVLDHDLRVVDAEGRELAEGHIGEVTLRGPAVMQGYYRNPEATRLALREGWLHTGDLGFVLDGQLHVTGRSKEMIIVRGTNVYPMDVEALVRELPGIHRDGCVAFGLGEDGHEQLAVLVETKLREPEALQQLARTAQGLLSAHLGLGDARLYLVAPRTLERTTSGKYQRLLMRQRLLTGALGERIIHTHPALPS
jgi:acyl-CoA synthetase (AMP-forming)/AMP-acid ligase II